MPIKSSMRSFDDILKSNYLKQSQWASNLRKLMQNIDRNIFPGINALENSTVDKYLQSFVLSKKGESLYVSSS